MDKKPGKPDSTTAPLADPRQWVLRHADYLYNFAIARLDDEETARDLVQETFLAALERLSQFEGKSNERTWLTAILKHKIIDVYRKRSTGLQANKVSIPSESEEVDFFNAEDGHWNAEYRPQEWPRSSDDPLFNKELNAVLQHCLQKLPALWFAVFTMKHMDDLATDAICKDLKVTSANFWVIIHRTKLNLRACLQRNWV